MNNLSQLDIINEMLDQPTLEEIQKIINRVNNAKTSGHDGIPVETSSEGGGEGKGNNKLAVEIYCLYSLSLSHTSSTQ